MSSFEVRQKFGTAVRNERADLRISQEELADRSGLHRTYISDVERGARNLSLESIERLARGLKLSIAALFVRAGIEAPVTPRVDILMVEDNADDAELVLRAFRKSKLTNAIHIARDGAEALDFLFARGAHEGRASQPLPGVILLDLNLPKVSGLEVLDQIKNDERTRHIPVVVLTGTIHDGDIAQAIRLGAATYIVKPVTFYNFSEITSYLRFEWTLKVETNGGSGRAARHENHTT